MGSGAGSAGGVWERGLDARGQRGEVEECLDFFLCFLDLTDFDDADFGLDELLQE